MCSLEALCRLAVTLLLVGGSPELQCLHYKLSDALLWSYHWSQRRKHRRRRMLQAPGKRSKLKEKILFFTRKSSFNLMRKIEMSSLIFSEFSLPGRSNKWRASTLGLGTPGRTPLDWDYCAEIQKGRSQGMSRCQFPLWLRAPSLGPGSRCCCWGRSWAWRRQPGPRSGKGRTRLQTCGTPGSGWLRRYLVRIVYHIYFISIHIWAWNFTSPRRNDNV